MTHALHLMESTSKLATTSRALELALEGRLRAVLHFRLIIIHRYRLERCEQVDDLILLQLRLCRIRSIAKLGLHRALRRYLRSLAPEKLLRRGYFEGKGI